MKNYLSYLLFSALIFYPAGASGQISLNQTPARSVGQDNIHQGAANLVEGRELNGPLGIALDTSLSPPALYVADTFNNRVLGFKNAAAFSNGQKADIVIGQLDFLSTSPQGPAVPTSQGGRVTGLSSPTGLAVDGKGNLYVVDSGNNRVLRFPSPFGHTTPFPDLAIGQPSFNTAAPNNGGSSASTLQLSTGNGLLVANLAFDSLGDLWVADAGNNRVLRFNVNSLGTGAVNGPTADIVLGQTDFVTTTYNNFNNDPTNLSALLEPTGLAFDKEGRLYVSESASNVRGRILIYNGPFATGVPANRLIGVVPSSVSPQPPAISEQQLGAGPGNLFIINDGVAIADPANNRILVYQPASQFTSNTLTQQAVVAIGQKNFSVGASNQGQPEASAGVLSAPQAAVATATEIYIADSGNNRVVVVPYSGSGAGTTFGAATRVLGQDQFYLNAPNLVEGREFRFQGPDYTAGIVADYNSTPPHLYVADTYNNRVLGFNDLRTVTFGSKADIVIGQPDFQRTLINYPSNDPTKPTASSLYLPIGLAVDSGGNLYVADRGNGRVLRFPAPFSGTPTLAQANLVLGQASLTGPTIIDASASTMSAPTGLAFASQNGLLVSDQVHNRVLYFAGTSATFTNGMAASKVFGQADFTSTAVSGSAASPGNRFHQPRGIATDVDDRLYVADTLNNRVAIFDRVTTAGPDPTPGISLVSTSAGANGVAITDPEGVFVNRTTGEIWVASTGSGAVVRFPQFNELAVSFGLPNYVVSTGAAPLAITQDGYGNLYTADSGNRVTINYPALSMLNAANYYPGRALAPGAIGSIFGFTNQFGTATQAASSLPLPTQLQNIQVLVGGTAAPLFYLGPAQINFQVPSSVPTSGSVEVTVQRTDTGQILGDYPLALDVASPALFSLNGSGQGQVVALNQDNTVNGPSNPAANGTVIQFFGTGQGLVPNMPADGTASSGLVPTPYTPQVIIGTGADNNPVPVADVQYSGLAPGLVGVWQINVLIPSTVAPTASSPGLITPVGIVADSIFSTGSIGATLSTTIWVKQPGK